MTNLGFEASLSFNYLSYFCEYAFAFNLDDFNPTFFLPFLNLDLPKSYLKNVQSSLHFYFLDGELSCFLVRDGGG